MNDKDIKFGEKLKLLLAEGSINRNAIVKAGICSRSSLSGYENGKNDPSYLIIIKLAKHFDIPPGYFFSEKSPSEYREFVATHELLQPLFVELSIEDRDLMNSIMEGIKLLRHSQAINKKQNDSGGL